MRCRTNRGRRGSRRCAAGWPSGQTTCPPTASPSRRARCCGAGAHSYSRHEDSGARWWNVARPRDYIAACPTPVAGGEELDARKVGAEMLMLGLRTADGLSAPPGFQAELDQLVAAGLIESENSHVTPTRRGLDLHNQIALAVL